MYTLESAIGVLPLTGSQWKPIDISTTPINVLFKTYRGIYITLSNPFISGNVHFDLFKWEELHLASIKTIPQLLIENANNTLETVETLPTFNTKYMRHSDAFRAAYKVSLCRIGTHPTTQIPYKDKTSLFLTKKDANYTTFTNTSIVSVNGYYHNVDTDKTGIYVIDGAKSMHKSRNNQIGITTFQDIGNITRVPLTTNNIFIEAPINNDLNDRVHIRINNDVTNKVPILILGGYMVLLDNIILRQTGDKTFTVSLAKFGYLEKIYESKEFLDLSELNLDTTANNINQINTSQLFSDEVVKKYFTMSQSFIILLDANNFFFNKIYIRKTPRPGQFISFKEPTYPLVVGCGRIAEYWKLYEEGVWGVNVQNSFLMDRVFNRRPPIEQTNVCDSAIPSHLYENSRGYLLEFGSDF